VGCSSGAWLEVSGALGWTATGVEPSLQTARAARERGLDVRPGTLAEVAPQLEAHSFDLVTFWDVLEHVRDPRRELALVGRLLAPGGVLTLSMPNEAGWYPRATYRLLARPTGVWEYPELPVHLYDFNPATISRLLVAGGYRVLGLRTWPVPYRYYRDTTLSPPTLGGGARGLGLRLAFGALRGVIYPLARGFGRSNYMGLAATRPAPAPGAGSAAPHRR
jgi:SAM-dependent methyltransferase